VEGRLFYLHNGFLAFNAALPLALALPLLAALQYLLSGGGGGETSFSPSGGAVQSRSGGGQLEATSGGPAAAAAAAVREQGAWLKVVAVLAPLWLWLAAISLLPHKEERFLYVVYPLVRLHCSPLFVARYLAGFSDTSCRDALHAE